MGTTKNVKPMSLTDIYKLIDDKKFEKAFTSLLDIKSVADKGDAVAQYYLGVLLFSNKEDAEGERYMKLSVDGNYLPAIRTCLQKYLPATRTHINVSEKERQSLLLKLMKSGDVNAMCAYAWSKLEEALGCLEQIKRLDDDTRYWSNSKKTFQEDSREAFMILYKAARTGNALALFMLSEIYRNGVVIQLEGIRLGAIIRSNRDHSKELLVRGANAGDILCLWKLIRICKDFGYPNAEKLRLLKIARDQYNNSNVTELINLFGGGGDFHCLHHENDITDRGYCLKKGSFSYFTYSFKGAHDVGAGSYLYDFYGKSCFTEENDLMAYIAGKTDELPDALKGLKPSALMQSGVTGVVDNTPLPDFLTADYKQFAKEIEIAKLAKEEREKKNSPEYQKKQRERAERMEKAKERKEIVRGCGCLLVIVAIVGFVIWWWIEGMTMAALPGMWEQAKNYVRGVGGVAKIIGWLLALFIVSVAIRKVKSGSAVSTSDRKRWKFVVLGLLFGFLGIHLAYAKRWPLFLLQWAVFFIPQVFGSFHIIGDICFDHICAVIWLLLWIGGALFIKKDGEGDWM